MTARTPRVPAEATRLRETRVRTSDAEWSRIEKAAATVSEPLAVYLRNAGLQRADLLETGLANPRDLAAVGAAVDDAIAVVEAAFFDLQDVKRRLGLPLSEAPQVLGGGPSTSDAGSTTLAA